jgi:hypothetical protein
MDDTGLSYYGSNLSRRQRQAREINLLAGKINLDRRYRRLLLSVTVGAGVLLGTGVFLWLMMRVR